MPWGAEALGAASLTGILEQFKRETWVFSLLLRLVLFFLQSCQCGFCAFLGDKFCAHDCAFRGAKFSCS